MEVSDDEHKNKNFKDNIKKDNQEEFLFDENEFLKDLGDLKKNDLMEDASFLEEIENKENMMNEVNIDMEKIRQFEVHIAKLNKK